GGERHEALDQLIARGTIVEAVQAEEEPSLLCGAHRVVLGCLYVAGRDVRSRHDESGLPGFAYPHSMRQAREDKGVALTAVPPPVPLAPGPRGAGERPPPVSPYPLPLPATRGLQARRPRPNTATTTPPTMTSVRTSVAGPTRCEMVSRPS